MFIFLILVLLITINSIIPINLSRIATIFGCNIYTHHLNNLALNASPGPCEMFSNGRRLRPGARGKPVPLANARRIGRFLGTVLDETLLFA
jgi:hypothetical protein